MGRYTKETLMNLIRYMSGQWEYFHCDLHLQLDYNINVITYNITSCVLTTPILYLGRRELVSCGPKIRGGAGVDWKLFARSWSGAGAVFS
jgi:hypothetical protein